jgi:DNA repair exonuclease SbcCD ATPase subunit
MGEETTQEFPKNSLAVILARFDSLDSRMDSFEVQLTTLDEKVDRRLMETRPIWQQVLSRLDSVDSRLDRVEEEFENMGLKFRTFQNDLLRMQTRDEKLAERIEKIENPPTA